MFRPKRGAYDDRSPYGRFWFEPTGSRSLSGVRVSGDVAMRLGVVYRCVDVLAKTFAVLPFGLYQPTAGGGRGALQRAHWLYKLLAKRPNRFQNPFEWRQMCMGHIALRGNAYNRIYANQRGEVTDLIPQHPDRVTIEMLPNGVDYRYLIRQPDGTDQPFARGDIWHMRGLSSDGVVGLSPLGYARDAIGAGIAAQDYGALYFRNAGAPTGGWIELGGKFGTDADRKAFKEEWKAARTGERRHETPVLEQGMKYHELGIKNDEAQFLECALPGTPVTMADGSVRAVEKLRVGDEVLSWDDGAFTTARVAATGKPPRKACVRITTARGRSLEVTADHPVLSKTDLRTAGGRPDCRPPEWIHAGLLRPGMYVRTGIDVGAARHGTDVPHSWLLGALVGDGYIRAGGCSFSGTDGGVLNRMREELACLGAGLRHKSGTADYEIVTGGVGRGGSAFRALINSHGLVGSGASTKRVPAAVMSGSAETKAQFLAGYLDTDGTVCHRGRLISWSSINRDLLEDCRALIASLGFNAAVYLVSRARVRMVVGQECQTQDCYQLVLCGRKNISGLAALLPASHSAKAQRLAALSAPGSSRYRAENWEYDRITSVERIGDHQAVGIEIEGTHTFVTGGIVTHNTRKFSVTDLCRFFGVPPHLAYDLDRSTNNNIEQQSLEFVIYTMTAIAEAWEASIEYEFLMDEDGLDPEFDMQRLLRADQKSRSDFYKTMFNLGAYSPNDIRIREGDDPVDGGEQRFVPVNMTVLKPNMQPSTAQKIVPADSGSDPEAPDEGARRTSNERLTAMAVAAAERVARREVAVLKRAWEGGAAALDAAMATHARFVSEALGVSLEAATEYCAQRRASLRPDDDLAALETVARCRLERLALS